MRRVQGRVADVVGLHRRHVLVRVRDAGPQPFATQRGSGGGQRHGGRVAGAFRSGGRGAGATLQIGQLGSLRGRQQRCRVRRDVRRHARRDLLDAGLRRRQSRRCAASVARQCAIGSGQCALQPWQRGAGSGAGPGPRLGLGVHGRLRGSGGCVTPLQQLPRLGLALAGPRDQGGWQCGGDAGPRGGQLGVGQRRAGVGDHGGQRRRYQGLIDQAAAPRVAGARQRESGLCAGPGLVGVQRSLSCGSLGLRSLGSGQRPFVQQRLRGALHDGGVAQRAGQRGGLGRGLRVLAAQLFERELGVLQRPCRGGPAGFGGGSACIGSGQ